MNKQQIHRGISVIICCYNSATRIKQTLQYLAAQELDKGILWELILVDNACTDETVELAKAHWSELGAPTSFKIAREDKPGLSNARKKGIAEANFDYVLFCDDDNWLAPDYIAQAVEFMSANANAGIVGGRLQAVSDVNFPEWFDNVKEHYACGSPEKNPGKLTGRRLSWGAGSVYRTNILKQVLHSQHPMLLSGRNGTILTSGDDDEMTYRVWLLGYDNYYCDKLHLQHFMPHNRLTPDYYKKLSAGFSQQSDIINSYERLYEVSRMTALQKAFALTKHISRFIKCFLAKSEIRKKSATDFLYYLTGFPLWSNNINQSILSFYKTANGNK